MCPLCVYKVNAFASSKILTENCNLVFLLGAKQGNEKSPEQQVRKELQEAIQSNFSALRGKVACLEALPRKSVCEVFQCLGIQGFSLWIVFFRSTWRVFLWMNFGLPKPCNMINMQLHNGGTFHIPRWASKSHGVFVHAAKSEPFGLCLLEAAASGLPVVASLSGGPGQIIQSFLAFGRATRFSFQMETVQPGFVKRSTCFLFFVFFPSI